MWVRGSGLNLGVGVLRKKMDEISAGSQHEEKYKFHI
jgi:hypothetical protein